MTSIWFKRPPVPLFYSRKTDKLIFPLCPSLSVWTDIYNTELKYAMSELAFNSPILPSHPCPAVFPFLSRGDVYAELCAIPPGLCKLLRPCLLAGLNGWLFFSLPSPQYTISRTALSKRLAGQRERERERLQSWQAPATLLAGLIVDRKSGSRVSHVTPMGWCLAQWSIVERGGDYTHSKPYSF